MAWDESERPETEGETVDFTDAAQVFGWRRQDVEGIVTEACLKPDFCDEPLDDDVARLALDLGLPPEFIARWRDLPDPPQAVLDAEPDDPDWRSSG